MIGYHPAMNYQDIITIEPGKRGGKACIRGTRMTVTDVLEYLASGMTPEEVLEDFPDLTTEDIRACLAFAAERERRMATPPETPV
jgi:uncharacterized protein (DUF433 family)